MKQWSSQIFPLSLLAALAALTFWLQTVVDSTGGKRDKSARHEPDSIAETITARRFDENGILRYRLVAPKMLHFPDNDTVELTHPTLVSYRDNAPPVILSGQRAIASSGGKTVYLWDGVTVVREGTTERAPLVATMPDLTARPDDEFAFTASPVRIDQGASWVTGVGAELDHKAATFVLLSQVRGQHHPERSP